MNSKLIALELYVVNNPWYTAFFAMVGMVGLGLGVRKLLAESDEARDGYPLRKGDRLD